MTGSRLPLLCCSLAAAVLGAPGRADDLPSPDAMWLGSRIVPRALVDGFRGGIVREAIERASGGAASASPGARARAGAALSPLLDQAFPEELLAGVAAQFLARNYDADELRTLRAREESPLGRKLRDFYGRAAALPADDPGARERERLARATFTAAEQRQIDEFTASPLGRKGDELALALAGFFLDALERRWAEVRQDLEPRLAAAAQRALAEPSPAK